MRTFKEWRGDCSTDHGSNTPIHTAGAYTGNARLNEDEEYEDGDILHFWYLCNQSSPAVQKFACGLYELLNECFPDEHKFVDTVESELSPLIHRYVLVRHGDER